MTLLLPTLTKQTIAPNLLNTLTGTIDNFNLSGGEDNAWAVSLQGGRTNIVTLRDGTASGMAQGGGAGVPWTATFHGPLGNHDDNDETPDIEYPGSVVGEFGANFSQRFGRRRLRCPEARLVQVRQPGVLT